MESFEDFTRLEGGGSNAVYRSGSITRRRVGPWSSRVHEFLAFLKQTGFRNVPEAVGFDEHGNELLTFIPGEVGNYPSERHYSKRASAGLGSEAFAPIPRLQRGLYTKSPDRVDVPGKRTDGSYLSW